MAPKRLANLAGNSYVSSSALAKILESVKHNPELLNESTSRYTLERRREEEVVVTGIYGDLVKEMHCTGKDGNPVTICYADPVVTVDHLARISPARTGRLFATRRPGVRRLIKLGRSACTRTKFCQATC